MLIIEYYMYVNVEIRRNFAWDTLKLGYRNVWLGLARRLQPKAFLHILDTILIIL